VEIETGANRCRARAVLAADGRPNLDQLLSAWSIRLVPLKESKMEGAEAFSVAHQQEIFCVRAISRGLRFGDPHARYVVGHELGHMFLHRDQEPKARKIGGNRELVSVKEERSAERQAWKFARALFVPRDDLRFGESNEGIALRVGIPEGAVELRREEVQADLLAQQPKRVPQIAAKHFDGGPSAIINTFGKSRLLSTSRKMAAWQRAARIEGEDPAKFRSARGLRVDWDHHGLFQSQLGWTIVKGEVRAFIDLWSR
jgi:Zn-dependent peptidase ImmA (M78 family)